MSIERKERLDIGNFDYSLQPDIDPTKPQRWQYPDMRSYIEASVEWFQNVGRYKLKEWLDEGLTAPEETEGESCQNEEILRSIMGDEEYGRYEKWVNS